MYLKVFRVHSSEQTFSRPSARKAVAMAIPISRIESPALGEDYEKEPLSRALPLNFRDAGRTVHEIVDRVVEYQNNHDGEPARELGMERAISNEEAERIKSCIAVGKLYRGGFVQDVEDPSVIFSPKCILNVRLLEDDVKWDGVHYLHLAAGKNHEKYNMREKPVREWMRETVKQISNLDEDTQMPLYVHCRFGKDRTGVVVALVLALLGVPHDIVALEYLETKEGHVCRSLINMVLNELPENVEIARKKFKGTNWKNLETIMRAH